MEAHDDDAVPRLVASVRRGSIIAAAGCGKTEQIARALTHTDGRRLILTHTHAGVEALRQRLKDKEVPEHSFAIKTIAGWSLRFAASFPARSGLSITEPAKDAEWKAVYSSAAALVKCGAVSRVLKASYSGLFVDEYQDCTNEQHEIVEAISRQIPTCVFGDPLQAIFGFGGQSPVSWEQTVFPIFPRQAELTRPWRWHKDGNNKLAEWLENVRSQLENEQAIDLNDSPACVSWAKIPARSAEEVVPGDRQRTIEQTCRDVEVSDDQRLIVIGDGKKEGARARLAKGLSKMYFANIEPVTCKALIKHGRTLARASELARLIAVLDFLQATMTGIPKADLKKSVESHQAGRKLGAKKFGSILPICFRIIDSGDFVSVIDLVEHFRNDAATWLYRSEMFYAMRSALRLVFAGSHENLLDAIWEVQNKLRHAGRRLRKRNIGSTLLVKGLEFHHSVIIDADQLSRNDLYVALTRASKTVTVLSPTHLLNDPS